MVAAPQTAPASRPGPAGAATPTSSPADRGRPSPVGLSRAFVLPVEGPISQVTLESLERRIRQAREDQADLIILEMNTPGGDVISMQKICTLIKGLEDIYTVAWIHPDAYSAGAVIALACDEIIVGPRATIGDCQPIMIGPSGVGAVPEDLEAKVVSPVETELRDSARRNGYDLNMCLALIQPDIEIFWVENRKTGERRFVQRAERDELFGIGPTRGPDQTVVTETRSQQERNTDRAESTRTEKRRTQPEYVSDSRSTTDWRYVKTDPILGQVTQPIVPYNRLLTMHQDEALAYGFARAKLASLDAIRAHYEIRGPVTVLRYSWSEKLVEWLTSPMVRGVLFVLMLLGAYAEFQTPGIGVPGIVALICLVVFLGAPYLTGLASVPEILLIVFGISLLLVEVFVIPGFGIAGIAGIVLLLVGLLMTFAPSEPNEPLPIYWPKFGYTLDALKTGLLVIALGLIFSIAGMVVLSRVLPDVPYVGRVVAPNPQREAVAMPDPYPGVAQVGDVGITESILRPAGKARFGTALVDVVTEGEFIDPNTRVEVIERSGNRIVVRKAQA